MDDDKAGIAAVQRLATKLLPDWCQHKNQGQLPGQSQSQSQGQGQGQGHMTEVRVASLRLASVAAALLLQQRQQLEQILDEEEDEEEEDDEEDDGVAGLTDPVKSLVKSPRPPVKSPLRVVYYKDPSELCTAVNDKQIAQQGRSLFGTLVDMTAISLVVWTHFNPPQYVEILFIHVICRPYQPILSTYPTKTSC